MKRITLTLFIFWFGALRLWADGGMYPISMIDKVPLRQAGLRITTHDIFNPSGEGGLVQAVVQLGGCTGSFVSGRGLIITNHHCAFSSLGPYSTPQNNLFEKGYLAKNMKTELPIKGMTCKILESYKDISAEVLKNTEKISDPIARQNEISRNLKKIAEIEGLRSPDLQIEISEMLPGISYVLFRYRVLKDIRIVYIPARNIGEFGGEADNWEWPRHTGDFSFLRAYIGKNGESNTFDSTNVPYEPAEYLNISAEGVSTNDFVFILGFPGRTFRHQPAAFMGYQKNYLLPFISNLYDWQINTIRQAGQYNPNWLVKMEPRMKSLANVMKNYQGKLKTVGELNLYEKKKEEDQSIYDKLQSPDAKSEYSRVLSKTDSLYQLMEKNTTKYLWYNQTLTENNTLKIARYINLLRNLYAREPKMKQQEFDSEKVVLITALRQSYRSIFLPYDSLYLKKMFTDAANYQGDDKIPVITQLMALANKKKSVSAEEWIRMTYAQTKILDSNYVFGLMNKSPRKFVKMPDNFLCLSDGLYLDYAKTDSMQTSYRTMIDALLPRYVDLKMQAMNGEFVPDANRTLRLTYGYIKGYEPRDGVEAEPFTTVAGMLQKGTWGVKDYTVNDDLAYIYTQHKSTPFYSPSLHDIPLCMLYNTDTTGGNSGSPILNKFGQLVGLNFDRTFEATVNDYAWDDSYSRSIGLDIRFVLWTVKDVAKADYLIDEMFIDR